MPGAPSVRHHARLPSAAGGLELTAEETGVLAAAELARFGSEWLQPPDLPSDVGMRSLRSWSLASLRNLVTIVQASHGLEIGPEEQRVLRLACLLAGLQRPAFGPWLGPIAGGEVTSARVGQSVLRGRWVELRERERLHGDGPGRGAPGLADLLDEATRSEVGSYLGDRRPGGLGQLAAGTAISACDLAWVTQVEGAPSGDAPLGHDVWRRSPTAAGRPVVVIDGEQGALARVRTGANVLHTASLAWLEEPHTLGMASLVQSVLALVSEHAAAHPALPWLCERSELLALWSKRLDEESARLAGRLVRGPVPLPVYAAVALGGVRRPSRVEDVARGLPRRAALAAEVEAATGQRPLIGALHLPAVEAGLEGLLVGAPFPRKYADVRGGEQDPATSAERWAVAVCLPDPDPVAEQRGRAAAVAFFGSEGLPTLYHRARMVLRSRTAEIVHALQAAGPGAVLVLRHLARGAPVTLEALCRAQRWSKPTASVYMGMCMRRVTAAGLRDRMTVGTGPGRRKVWQVTDEELRNALREFLGG